MYLNLHLIIDLITNTLNNCFLDDVKMESIKDKGDGVLKIIYHSKEEERKYEITSQFSVVDNVVTFDWASLTILDRASEIIPHITTSYSASGLMEFETSTRYGLRGCWFYKEELKEVM